MLARDIMTSSITCVRPDTPIAAAIDTMLTLHVSGLPVLDGTEHLVGIVTEGDLLRRRELDTDRHRPKWLDFLLGTGRLSAEYVRTQSRRVGDLMTTAVVTAPGDAPLEAVVDLMDRHAIKRVPILDGDRLIGIVSRVDLLRALSRLLRKAEVAMPRSDEAIQAAVRAKFAAVACIPKASIAVMVRDGVVTLTGIITDERERGAARVAVETVEGVTGVSDRLSWVDPFSGLVLPAPDDPPDPIRDPHPVGRFSHRGSRR